MNLLPPDPAQSQTPVNLLIVDDVPQNLVAMQALLQREGVNCCWPARARRRWSCCWSTRWRWHCWTCTCRRSMASPWPS
jgi:CheY-like chemotaxis protein